MATSAPAAAPAIGSFTSEAFTSSLSSSPSFPAWWQEKRKAAFTRFAETAMPRRTDEPWRFSTLSTLSLDGFALPPAAELSLKGPAQAFAAQPTLAFVNNRQVSLPGTRPALPAGVTVGTLSQASSAQAEILKAHFMAQPQKLGSEKFAALHGAFLSDGAFIHVPKGVEVPHPIVVIHAAAGPGAAVFPHTLVVAEENSKVSVVDFFVSTTSDAHFACGANDLYAGHGANLSYLGVQLWSPDTLSFQLNSTVVRRDARVQSLNVHLGARQARHESLSQLQAPGAFSEMLALTVADGAREFDQRTLQVHQAPNTKSDLLYKNALMGRSRTIFSGLIIVDPDAQKTDAYQSNRNLVLSEECEASSLPGLEIQANDVRCTHGATTSRIDPEQLFYLQTRGIPTALANELLVFGFFEEVLNRLQNDDLHASVRTLIESQFKS